jgi:hypothetical protein
MKCKHCSVGVVPDGKAFVHVTGMYRCRVEGSELVTYAEPMGEEDGASSEKKFCGCGAEAAGSCENCGADLCVDHDSGEFEDVMVCGDREACEKALRRKAVADRSRTLFSDAHLGATEAV